MKVAVLGGGVIGVTSAYYLAQSGHEVTLIERRAGVGLETSYANAGEISPGYAAPWAAPGVPLKALKWLFMEHAPLILRPQFDRAMLGWLLGLLRNCTEARYAVNKRRMVRLAEYSRDQLALLRNQIGIDYDQRMQGTLQLFRSQKQIDEVAKDIEVLRAYGVPYQQLDARGCVEAEPGLAASLDHIAGGLRLPNDETGDCFKFTQSLVPICAELGVDFRLDTRVEHLVRSGDNVAAVRTSCGDVRADAFVVAMGSLSASILAPLGLKFPVYPVKGYSITVPVCCERRSPQSTILDETYKIAITRLGQRIRVGGMAEISGFNDNLDPPRRRTLEYALQSLFPGAGHLRTASFWTGLRPMTPDGTPLVGATPIANLFTNTGHGTLGWTMACGSGRVLADILSGLEPEIEAADLSIARYAVRSRG